LACVCCPIAVEASQEAVVEYPIAVAALEYVTEFSHIAVAACQ